MASDLSTRIVELVARLTSERDTSNEVLAQLNRFADIFFDTAVDITSQLNNKTDIVTKAVTKRSSDGTRQLRFMVGEHELTFRTAERTALPYISNENLGLMGRKESPCGALWMFIDLNKAPQHAWYQVYVFGDGYWFGSGVAGPVFIEVCAPLNKQTSADLFMGIMESILNIRSEWRNWRDIKNDGLSVARESIGFKTT